MARPLIYPHIGECWICEDMDLLIAHDTTVNKSICLGCLDNAVIVDINLQHAYSSKIYHRNG